MMVYLLSSCRGSSINRLLKETAIFHGFRHPLQHVGSFFHLSIGKKMDHFFAYKSLVFYNLLFRKVCTKESQISILSM